MPIRAAPDAGAQVMVERYEDLRCQVLGEGMGRGGNAGLALFVRQGMAGWMRAWSDCQQPDDGGSAGSGPSDELLPRNIEPEVVMVLAGMALNLYQEVA